MEIQQPIGSNKREWIWQGPPTKRLKIMPRMLKMAVRLFFMLKRYHSKTTGSPCTQPNAKPPWTNHSTAQAPSTTFVLLYIDHRDIVGKLKLIFLPSRCSSMWPMAEESRRDKDETREANRRGKKNWHRTFCLSTDGIYGSSYMTSNGSLGQ